MDGCWSDDDPRLHANPDGLKGEDGRRVAVRMECRGLVLGASGEVLVRPLHKSFGVGQMRRLGLERGMEGGKVEEVLEKLEGHLVVGVVGRAGIELWSRKGRTAVGWSATVFAEGRKGYTDLILEMEACGCTVCFEYVGRQSKVKVGYQD
jgi:hypothetical protein